MDCAVSGRQQRFEAQGLNGEWEKFLKKRIALKGL
jgi:hypothetical protein